MQMSSGKDKVQDIKDQLLDITLKFFLEQLKGVVEVIKFSGKKYSKIYLGKEFKVRCIAGYKLFSGKWFEIELSYNGQVVYRTGRQDSPKDAVEQAEAFTLIFKG